MYPPNLNVPLPDPSQLAPEQTAKPDRMQQALSLITPLFALGTAMGGSPQAGASFLHGAHQTLQRQDQERQVKAHQDAQIAQRQAEFAALEQHRAAQEEAQRQQAIQKVIMDTAVQARAAKTRDEYESIITANEALAGQFYGLRPNTIRAAVPYHAPSANQKMADAGLAFLKNPANAQAIENGDLGGSIMVDVQDDGKPLAVPLMDVLSVTPGVQIDPETHRPIFIPKEKKTTGGVQLDDEAFLGEVAKFEAEKGRKATQDERGQIALRVKKQMGDAGRAPAISVNLGNGGAADQQIEKAAQAIIEHRMAPSQAASLYGGMGKDAGAFKRAMIAKVEQIDPTFNFQEAESGYQFGKNTGTQTTVRMIDNIMHTLPVLEKASDDFKRSGVRMINKATLAAKSQFGDTTVAQFEAARLGLADEVAKILSGGGTGNSTSDAKLKQANELLAADMTPGQLKATIAMVRQLLSTRRGSLTSGTYMDNQDSKNPDAGAVVWGYDATGKLVRKKGA